MEVAYDTFTVSQHFKKPLRHGIMQCDPKVESPRYWFLNMTDGHYE